MLDGVLMGVAERVGVAGVRYGDTLTRDGQYRTRPESLCYMRRYAWIRIQLPARS